MLYRKLVKNGPDISLLGYGCMRFKTKAGRIDKETAFSQMKLAFDNGVNYYDTAYPYHRGKSEIVLGEFIKKYNIRDKIYIADKLPRYLITKPEQIQSFFSTQLARLGTNYIDFYLMHAMGSLSDWETLKSLGIIDFIKEKKASGEIKYIGFSFHGKAEEFIKLVEAYEWDFCQIQYNYLDEYNQAGIAGLKRAYELGLGVVIMEPLRGGSLAAKAPDKVKEIFKSYKENHSPAYWGLRFVMNHKEVSTVLSGMNLDEHIIDNVNVASVTQAGSMDEEELSVIEDVKKVYKELVKVPCTGCGYCMPCPFGVDIPNIFNDYNSLSFFGRKMGVVRYQYISKSTGFIGDKSGADLCVNCGKCKEHCPQFIDIPVRLKEAHKSLDNKLLRAVMTVLAKLMNRNKKTRTRD